MERRLPETTPHGPVPKPAFGEFRDYTPGVDFGKLRTDAARHIKIDPDRLSIRATDTAFHFEVTVEGEVTIEDEWELRQYLHKHSPVWARWQVKATVRPQ